MTNRTTQSVVRFTSAFSLAGLDALQPAGSYRVDHDEELIEGISRPVWLRTDTFIHLPSIDAPGTRQQMVRINPADLEAALEKDNNRQ